MTDVSDIVFKRLKEYLITINPRNLDGLGFDDSNVLSYETPSSLPRAPYDFVSVSVSDNTQAITPIASTKDIGATVTFTINIYAKNINDLPIDREAIQARARINLSYVNDVMNEMGFRRLRPMEYNNHNGIGIYRIAVNYTRMVGINELK